MNAIAAILIVVAGVLAYLLERRAPAAAGGLLDLRRTLFSLGGLGFALLLLSTGVWRLMLAGALGLFMGFVFVFHERPDQEVW